MTRKKMALIWGGAEGRRDDTGEERRREGIEWMRETPLSPLGLSHKKGWERERERMGEEEEEQCARREGWLLKVWSNARSFHAQWRIDRRQQGHTHTYIYLHAWKGKPT